MGDNRQVTFEQLWQINSVSPIGLTLTWPEHAWQYYCTPKNVRTFASTGHDGVHFSFLALPATTSHFANNDFVDASALSVTPIVSPIVMTVPMNFEIQNIIVAETLHEFLCLGCRAGFAQLEALACIDGNLAPLKSFDYAENLSPKYINHLQTLSERFALSPIRQLEARMRQLQIAYLQHLQLGEVETVGHSATFSLHSVRA